MRKCILSGNRQEFERYLDENGLTDSEVFYGHDERSIIGQEYNEIVAYGTFWEKKNAGEVYDFTKDHLRPFNTN